MHVSAKPARIGGSPSPRVLANTTYYLLGNIAGRVIGFIAIPFYAHYLSTTQYGIIELIELSTQIVAITFGIQSIGAALTRLFHDQETAEGEADIVSTSVISTALFSALIAAGAILSAGQISLAVFHSADQAPLLQTAFVAMWLSNMVEVVLVYHRIRQRARFFFIYSMVSLAASLAFNIYFIGFAEAGVWGFVYSKLIVTGVGTVFLVGNVMREVGWHWRQEYVSLLFRFGLPLGIAGLSTFAIHFSDRFFLADVVSLSELGQYALCYKFAFLVTVLVADSFGKGWYSSFYRFAREDGWKDRFARVGRYFIFALYVAALGISLTAPDLLSFMVPTSFYPPYLLLPMLVFADVLRSTGDFFSSLLLINRRSGMIGKVVFGGAVLNGGFNFALIPRFGIYGAAVATMGTWLVYLSVFWFIARREHRLPIRVLSFVKITLFAIGIFALADALRVDPPALQLAIDGLWVLLFMLLCFMFYFSSAERGEILSTARTQARRLLGDHQPASAGSLDD